MLRIECRVDPPAGTGPFPFQVHEVRDVELAIGSELRVGRVDRLEEIVVVIDDEPGALRLHLERFQPADARVVAHDEGVFVALVQARPAREKKSARTGADAADGRDDVRRLTRVRQVPEPFGVPRAGGVRVVDRLVGHVPAARAAVHDVDETGVIPAVAVVVVGEQVAELIECEFLRIAQAAMDHFQFGAVGVAAEHGPVARADKLFSFLARHIEAAIADAEVELAIGPEDQPVQVVAVERDVHAEAGEQLFLHVRDAGALRVLQLVQAGDVRDEDFAVARQHTGAEAIERIVKPPRKDGAPVGPPAAGGVFQAAHLIRIRGEVAVAAGHFGLPLVERFQAIVEGVDLEIVFEVEAELVRRVVPVLGRALAEAEFLGRVDPALFIDADGHGAGELRLGGPQLGLHPLRHAELGHLLRGGVGAVGQILHRIGLRRRGDEADG